VTRCSTGSRGATPREYGARLSLQKALSVPSEPSRMVSRRRLLQLGAGMLAATAGCVGVLDDPADEPAAPAEEPESPVSPPDAGDGPTTTPGDCPRWEPAWSRSFDGANVLGLDAADGLLFATLSTDDGAASVAAIDPGTREVLWRTESSGQAVSGSHASEQGIARGQWGATVTEASVYTVAGAVDEREWSALHALDRASGERRWSLERDRRLGVAGVREDLVVATGLEFFPGPEETPLSHQTPEEPLVTVVYGLDPGDGTIHWKQSFEAVGEVAVSPDGVFVAADDRLVGLDGEGGTRFTLDRGPATRVEAAPGRIYYLTGSPYAGGPQTLHGVAPDGSVEWRHALPVDELLLDDTRLYAGGEVVVAVDPDGSVAWHDGDHGKWLLLDGDGDSLYTRSGTQSDAVTAYATAGEARWTFDPPSSNAWPEAATADGLMATAITGESADEPFKTVYAVDGDGEATAARGVDTVFDSLGLDGTVYLGDGASNLHALDL
jgi:hypothetical protein